MNGAITGGLIGVAIAVVLYFFEYSALNKAASERAKKKALPRAELEPFERARLRSLGSFCLFLPFLCAAIGWAVQ